MSTVDTGERSRWRRIAGVAATTLAAVVLLFALIAPDDLTRYTPGAFVRIPLEGLIVVALLLVLPGRWGRILAGVVGGLLGLVTIVKVLNMGFRAAFVRPFDPIGDWAFLGPAIEYLKRSIGPAAAWTTTVIAGLLIVAVPVVMVFAALRLSRVLARHRTTTARAVGGLTVVWVICALVGVQIVPGLSVASTSAAGVAYGQVGQVRADMLDSRRYAAEQSFDAYHDTPGDQLLTGLRGKDVMLVFVESYGRYASQDPGVDKVLDDGTAQLAAAGYTARTGFLTSSTAGGGSWLAHSTLQSGLWINNPQRYSDLVHSSRMTLARAFGRAGWRTVALDPANRDDWPEASFYGYNQVYDSRTIGYKGPDFNFASIPDQYTLSAYHRLERSAPGHPPVFSEIDLLSSHAPWSPIPTMMDWNAVGDGSTFVAPPGAGDPVDIVFQRDSARVRGDYLHSIEYSVGTLVSYVQKYGGDNLVMIFLGDHEPAPVAIDNAPDRDVPITIVAHDPAVLDRIGSWGWTPGLRPDANAPTWKMDAFRDNFLAAYGPQAQALAPPHR